MRRSQMPVREEIHSSLVSMKVEISPFDRILGGRHLPQPVMAAFGIWCPSRVVWPGFSGELRRIRPLAARFHASSAGSAESGEHLQ